MVLYYRHLYFNFRKIMKSYIKEMFKPVRLLLYNFKYEINIRIVQIVNISEK